MWQVAYVMVLAMACLLLQAAKSNNINNSRKEANGNACCRLVEASKDVGLLAANARSLECWLHMYIYVYVCVYECACNLCSVNCCKMLIFLLSGTPFEFNVNHHCGALYSYIYLDIYLFRSRLRNVSTLIFHTASRF